MPWATAPAICPSTISGWMIRPASSTQIQSRMRSSAVSGAISILATCAPAANAPRIGS